MGEWTHVAVEVVELPAGFASLEPGDPVFAPFLGKVEAYPHLDQFDRDTWEKPLNCLEV